MDSHSSWVRLTVAYLFSKLISKYIFYCSEALAYLPIATQSPPFTIKDSEKRKRYKNLGTRAKGIDMEVESGQPTNTSGEESTPIDEKQHQLQLFDSCVTSLHGDDSLVFNVGGAVCAMDWLLQPRKQ